MAYDMMDDESAPPTSEDASVANDSNETKGEQADNEKEDGEATEDQLSLVPKHFFKEEPKPGMREMVEVVDVYEGEVSIKCVYGDKDDDDKEDDMEEEGMSSESSPVEAEDEMMA